MKGTISNSIIGVIIFLSVFSGIAIFYGELSTTYSVENSTTDFTEINKSQADIETRVKNIQDKLQTSSKNPIDKIFDIAALFLFEVGGLVLGLGSAAISLVGETGTLFTSIPIPSWFIGMIISIVIVYFVFKVIGLIMKKEA